MIMSNYKSNLQTNNSALNTNNINIQNLIEQANNLPNNNSNSLENCTVTFTPAYSMPSLYFIWLTYDNNNFILHSENKDLTSTEAILTVVKGTPIIIQESDGYDGSCSYSTSVPVEYSTLSNSMIGLTFQEDALVHVQYNECCFIPGTQIQISLEGDTQAIETLQPGDSVVAYNIHTKENYLAKVKKLIINKNTTDIAEVYFKNGKSLTMNAYHPIYTEDGFHSITQYNGYKELKIGDKVKTTDGWTTIIDIVRYTSEPIITYNIDVIDINETTDNEENDTFIANGIVVHNAGCPS